MGYEVVEDYLDEHKEKAFKSSMFEPCRLYFDLVGNACHRDHVDVHGLNWFLVMLRGGLGVQLPLIPMDNEGDTIGFCHCWGGLHEDKAWPYFADPKNFGKSFEEIKTFRRSSPNRGKFVRDRSLGGRDDPTTRGKARSFAGGNCQVVERRCRNGDKACKPLYDIYQQHTEWAGEDSLLEHLYGPELTHLDVDRATAFLAWLGVCKPMAKAWTPETRGAGLIETKTSSESLHTPPEENNSASNEIATKRTLADITADLQRAMQSRDVTAIRQLMKERSELRQTTTHSL